MIIYVTRPDNHELVMGGTRSLKMWAECPDFHHHPELAQPLDPDDPKRWIDRGWAVGRCTSNQPFKPLFKQDEALAENAWNLIAWSACPKPITLEGWKEWAGYEEPGQDEGFEYDNWSNLMWHRNSSSDLASNIHHKRFLLQVNLRTNECEIIVPRVFIYNCTSTTQASTITPILTQDIDPELAVRRYYACPGHDLPL